MAEVRGFKGIRYQAERIGSYSDVVTPPFDVISPEERRELAGRSPYNMAHILLPEAPDGGDKYAHAAALLSQWRAEGVMAQDDAECVYLLEQRFTGLDGVDHVRRGFFARAKLPEEGERTILGHERTFHYKVEDRLALTRAVQANLGAVFVLYDDPNQGLASMFAAMDERDPDIEADTIDGAHQRIWRMPAPQALTEFFADKTLYIADGHHRYRTAWTYRDAMRAEHGTGGGPKPYDYVMLGFVPLQDPGLIVYPAHRVLDTHADFDMEALLHALEPWFEVRPAADPLDEAVNAAGGCAIGLAARNGERRLLKLRDIDRAALLGEEHGPAWRDLDVSVLHGGIFERIMHLPSDTEFVYEKDPVRAVGLVGSGEKDLAFILPRMRPEQICRCADAGEFMPQKATYFYPKLPSGGALHSLIG